MSYSIAAFYRFVALENPPALRQEFLQAFAPLDLCGTLLIAPEGINGTLAGSADSIEAMLGILHQRTGLPREDVKFSAAEAKPFNRLKIRLKREIITFKQPVADPAKLAGTYVEASDWNNLLDDPEITLLDTRNSYETGIGSFEGAAIPPIETFTQFADYVRANLDPARHKKIAMFCTGGIRCEKASAFMRAEGFDEVYHLRGGILKYLETVAPEQSRWQGECYVFDRRMAVGHGLVPGSYGMCFTCGAPLADSDKAHPHYEEGVSCAHCFAATNDADKTRYRMRQRQMTEHSAGA
ncbi:MAG: rhodanese-related sulfurtransferase [Alphaproteobacteria bacterium]|nr:rhodanese-related sulfurtransferase [Alphaproteobacteria bacterium]